MRRSREGGKGGSAKREEGKNGRQMSTVEKVRGRQDGLEGKRRVGVMMIDHGG